MSPPALRRGSVHALPGLRCSDLWLDVPVHHDAPERGTLTLYAREVVAADAADAERPWLIFLQGGPGFGGPRPLDASGWLGRAVREYRVLLLDSRGNGRSTPLTGHGIAQLDDDAAEEYVAAFRADAIVRDCELLRAALDSPPWTVLGQSFGGFCLLTYLSLAPEGLAAGLFTGGVPPMGVSAADVYRHTYPRVVDRNARYHERFPDDAERWARVAERVNRGDVRLPCGDVLSVRRLQLLGLLLGFEDGAGNIHHLVEEAFEADGEELTLTFLKGVEGLQHFDTNPIFSVLHEPAYAEGEASAWAAQAVRAEFPEVEADGSRPFPFTGEMIYPWMFAEIGALRPFATVAERLARRTDWPALYDPDVLARNSVQAVAAVYDEDLYVDRELSLQTAEQVPGLRLWTSNAHQHCALRRHGEEVFGRLLDMLHGRA